MEGLLERRVHLVRIAVDRRQRMHRVVRKAVIRDVSPLVDRHESLEPGLKRSVPGVFDAPVSLDALAESVGTATGERDRRNSADAPQGSEVLQDDDRVVRAVLQEVDEVIATRSRIGRPVPSALPERDAALRHVEKRLAPR